MPSYQEPAVLLQADPQKRYRHCAWLAQSTQIFAIYDDGKQDIPAIFDSQQPNTPIKQWRI